MKNKHWIQKAIKHPGALRKELKVPAGGTIPMNKLVRVAKGSGKEAKRARLAIVLKHL